jgi:hypothetical protein
MEITNAPATDTNNASTTVIETSGPVAGSFRVPEPVTEAGGTVVVGGVVVAGDVV